MPVPDSLTVDALKRRVDIEGSINDDLLAEFLQAAFLQAQAPSPNGCGRLLEPDPAGNEDPPVIRRIQAHGRRRVAIPDAREITAVTVDGTPVSEDGYDVLEMHGHIVSLTFRSIASPRVVEVTGRFGFRELPADLKEAIYTLAARYHYERDAQYADQVAFAEGAGVQSYYRQLPPRTKLAFASYAIPTGILGLA